MKDKKQNVRENVFAHARRCREARRSQAHCPRYTGADLRGAHLRGANLRYANLRDVNLRDASLRVADLRDADLRGADLRYADLRDAGLEGADLRDADLESADLRDADLGGANLRYADLRGTCLDPAAEIVPPSADDCRAAGFSVRSVGGRDRVYGLRTQRSVHVGNTVYRPRRRYTAPAFSVATTPCHPGLYFGAPDDVRRDYSGRALVECWAWRDQLHRAGNKWRARSIYIVREWSRTP